MRKNILSWPTQRDIHKYLGEEVFSIVETETLASTNLSVELIEDDLVPRKSEELFTSI